MDVQLEMLADYACVVGEGPLWHPLEKRLYWVDIGLGRLFRYDPATGASEQVYEGEPIGGFTVQADGALLLFMTRGAIRLWRDGQLTTVVEGIPAEKDHRFNDVIADPAGRVFCGTLALSGQGAGRLYRLDRDGSLTLVLDDVLCSNGMGFPGDRRTMYFTDSLRQQIYLFDYDEASGALTNRRLFVEVPASLGLPDGMTVDADDYVWSANWGGGCLLRFDPQGAEVARISFPVVAVSSVVFGGDESTDMYVTTARGNAKETDGAAAGALFRLRVPGVRGRPEFLSRVLL
jgi:D-xylonolactonase